MTQLASLKWLYVKVKMLCTGGCKVSNASVNSLKLAASLLGCEEAQLQECLITRFMQASRGGSKGTLIKYDDAVPRLELL